MGHEQLHQVNWPPTKQSRTVFYNDDFPLQQRVGTILYFLHRWH